MDYKQCKLSIELLGWTVIPELGNSTISVLKDSVYLPKEIGESTVLDIVDIIYLMHPRTFQGVVDELIKYKQSNQGSGEVRKTGVLSKRGSR